MVDITLVRTLGNVNIKYFKYFSRNRKTIFDLIKREREDIEKCVSHVYV